MIGWLVAAPLMWYAILLMSKSFLTFDKGPRITQRATSFVFIAVALLLTAVI